MKFCFTLTMFFFLTQICNAFNIIKVPQDYSLIQEAIQAANNNDTVLVSSGVYEENIFIDKPLYLLSVNGPQSTTIKDPEENTSWGTRETMVIYINAAGYGEVKGFTLIGKNDVNGAGILVEGDGWLIQNCIISRNQFGIKTYESSTNIHDNILRRNSLGIGAGQNSLLTNNNIFDNEDGIIALNTSQVYNNVIVNSYTAIKCGAQFDAAQVYNNVITTLNRTTSGGQQTAIRFENLECQATVTNNLIAYCGRRGFFSSVGDGTDPGAYTISYNNVFSNRENYFFSVGDRESTEGNIGYDPIFCDNDSLFFLASDSPLIDKGDSTILDVDGSRSDIGISGGQFAKYHHYAPASFNLISPIDSQNVNPTQINLKWEESYDIDENSSITYQVILGRSKKSFYRHSEIIKYKVDDIVDTFFTNSTNISITNLEDSVRYYWNVQALDNTDLLKNSDSLFSFFTSPDVILNFDEQPSNTIKNELQLFQNYPNPFNPITIIKYSIPNQNNVTLKVFDMLGSEVTTLVNKEQPQGNYEVEFDGSELTSGIYFYRLSAGDFVEKKKMILLK